jgi:SAM-dependent methyltransferase
MDDLRQISLRLAADYDAVAYETPADPHLAPHMVLGFGAVFGCPGALGDVLDLGCGAGVQLAQAGAEMTGRLVGADISEEHCRRARERLAPFGARAQLHCGDILDLTPDSLGRFDLIYAIGFVFAVPPEIRAHALALIGACLRPGGVALISHYAGAMARTRAELHALMRREIPASLPPQDAVARARAMMPGLAQTPPLQEAAALSASLPDNTLFHEVFNPFCGPVPLRELDAALAPAGIRFLGHLEAPASGLKPMPDTRVQASDARDETGVSYHYAIFGKGARPPDLTAPHIAWSTGLRPLGRGFYRAGEQTVEIAHGPTRAALDAIAARPLPFLIATQPTERDVTARIFRDLWAQNLVTPLRI